ncbi:MAG: cell division protein FtsQ/DivIB [Bdellovibrionales bacterium]
MTILKRLGWTFAALVGLGMGAAVWLTFNPYWIKIESVQVVLAPGSTQDLLYQRIKTSLAPQFQYFSGRFFWEVPLSKVYEIASKDKRVRKVQIYREFPSKLRVEVEPQTPVLAYLSGDNRIYPIAADATLLPALTLQDVPDLPILRGEEFRDEQKVREAALDLFEQIPSDGNLRKKAVSEILYSKKDGFRIFLNGTSSEIRMGDADFGPKLSRVEKVLAYLDSQNIKGRVIDARFSKKVVVRVRKGP